MNIMVNINTGPTRSSISSHRRSSSSVEGIAPSRRRSSTTQQLAETVAIAAKRSRKINTQAANIAQLRLSNLKLHGRDDDIKLLRSKFRELAKKKKDDDEKDSPQNNEQHDDESNPNKQSTNNNLILVSGISGTGKSALIRKGLGEPAAKNGYAFASGKFDENVIRPLSAFSDAMTSLAKHIMTEHNMLEGLSSSGGLSIATLIRDKIRDEFDEDDVEQLRRVLPGCAKLLRLGKRRHSLFSPSDVGKGALTRSASDSKLNSLDLLAGKESISHMHFAIKRLLKIMCSNLKGVILFVDDLQWSDTATLGLLKSIVSDREIPSLLIVGAFREDEVPE